MNKGEMMKKVYSEKELRSIDSAIPKEYWDGVDKSIQVDSAIHVMNYNKPHGYGKLENMEEIAVERGIELYPFYIVSYYDSKNHRDIEGVMTMKGFKKWLIENNKHRDEPESKETFDFEEVDVYN